MKLKSILGLVSILVLTLSLCLTNVMVLAQSPPTIHWLDQFSPDGPNLIYGLDVDGAGNSYVIGYTDVSLPGENSSGGRDAFIRKYDKFGNILWTNQFGSSTCDIAHDIAVDMAGNSYVAGRTDGTLPGQTNSGNYDAFIYKYDKFGNVLWADQFGTSSKDYAYGVATDSLGNAYVAGYTQGTLPGQSSSGNQDAFIRKYDRSGNELWTIQYGTNEDDCGGGVAIDGAGNVYVGGWTEGAFPSYTNSGNQDAFIRKYDKIGNLLWTDQFGSNADDSSGRIVINAAGNVYLNGNTQGALPGQSSSGGRDVFVRKYDKQGNELWTIQYGTNEDDSGCGVAVDGAGNVYAGGWTEGAFPSQTPSGGRDVFIRKYDKQGNELWTYQFGTSDDDRTSGIAVAKAGSVYIGGWTEGAFPGQTPSGERDAFIVKFERR